MGGYYYTYSSNYLQNISPRVSEPSIRRFYLITALPYQLT